jgi:hypothetical protein
MEVKSVLTQGERETVYIAIVERGKREEGIVLAKA